MTSYALNIEVGMLRSKSGTYAHAILGSLLFIAVIVNTSIGYVNEYVFDGVLGNIGQLFFWLVLGLSFIITLSFRKRYVLFVLLLIALIGIFRAMRILLPEVLMLYRFAYMLIIALASAVFFQTCKKVYEKWLKIFLVINFVLLTLQVLGISEIFHMWNTLFVGPNNVLYVVVRPTLFVSIDDLTAPFQQIRPPGLFYSNAVVAVFLIMVIGHRIGGSVLKFKTYDLILIVSVFLAMAKISVLFLFLVSVIRYFSCDANEKAARIKFLLVIPGVVLLFYILFPGVLKYSLNLNKFFASASIRVADILISQKIEDIPIIGVNNLRSEASLRLSLRYADEDDIGNLSGIKTMVILLPLLFLSTIVLKKRSKRRLIPYQVVSMSKYLILAFVFCFVATPILGSTLIAFMLGPAMVVFFNSHNTRSPTTQRRKP